MEKCHNINNENKVSYDLYNLRPFMGKKVQKILNILSYIYEERARKNTNYEHLHENSTLLQESDIFSLEKVQHGTLRD